MTTKTRTDTRLQELRAAAFRVQSGRGSLRVAPAVNVDREPTIKTRRWRGMTHLSDHIGQVLKGLNGRPNKETHDAGGHGEARRGDLPRVQD